MSQARLPFNPSVAASIVMTLLLAACSSGGGSDRVVSGTSVQPSSTPSSSTSTGTPSGTAGSSSATADTTASASSNGAQATTPSTSGAYTEAGIRADVFATMLDQRTETGPQAPGPYVPAAALPATGTHGTLITDSEAPAILVGSSISQDNYRYPSPGWQGLSNYDPGVYQPASGSFERYDSQTVLPLAQPAATLAFTPVLTRFEVETSSSALVLDETLHVEAGASGSSVELSAGADRTISRSTVLPYGEVLQQWRQGERVVQLILRKDSDNPATPALCWNYQLPEASRLSCTVWEIPADWKAGEALRHKGFYIVDERSHYAGETGQRYWRLSR